MPAKKKTSRSAASRRPSQADSAAAPTAGSAIAALKRLANQRTLAGMARYAIPSDHAFGVPMKAIQELGKRLGRSHRLAADLWKSGWYEARTLAAFVEEPQRVTAAQMDRWARDFDSWAICDTVCFKLFDQVPHAFEKVEHWAGRHEEFVKRAAFALLASLALHSKDQDERFIGTLTLIERAAADERNFVKKGVSWALRAFGRRGPALRAAATQLARRLAASAQPAERWIGKDALRDLTRARATRKQARRTTRD